MFSLFVLCIFLANGFASKSRHPLKEARRIHLKSGSIHVNEDYISQSRKSISLLDLSEEHHQWLVHMKSPITTKAKQLVNDFIAPYKLTDIYIPHNTFILVAPQEIALSANHAPGVIHVSEYRSDYKYKRSEIVSNFERTHQLRVYLSDMPSRTLQDVNYFSNLIVEELSEIDDDVRIKVVKEDVFTLESSLSSDDIMPVVILLSEYPQVHWITTTPKIKMMNKYSHAIVQSGSNDPQQTEIWNRGLTGENEIVGIADTGIDADMCFFADPNHPIPKGKVNREHRKLIIYQLADGVKKYGDEVGGHGTHTSCTLAGNALWEEDEETQSFMSGYNGMAPDAKIAFLDLGSADNLKVPDDLFKEVYKPSYELDARVHSNSWGDTDIGYDFLAQDTDKFVFQHQDFLPVFAAGNEGTRGLMTISSPGVAKNVLSVGASTNTKESFFEQGLDVGIRIETPEEIAGDYRASTAMFGPEFHRYDYINGSDAVLADPLLGCKNLKNKSSLHGKIAVFKRGTCSFFEKATRGNEAGAILIIILNTDGTLLEMGADEGTDLDSISVPTIMVNDTNGNMLKDHIHDIQISAPVSVDEPRQAMGHLADFSSRGPTADGRRKPDVVAPGSWITSAMSDGDLESNNCDGFDSLTHMEGTSMACPVAAGNVVLVRQYYREGFYPSGQKDEKHVMESPSAALMKATMINSGSPVNGTVLDISEIQTIEDLENPDLIKELDVLPPPSLYQGYGQATLNDVLYFEDSNFQLFVEDGVSVTTGESNIYCFNILSFDIPFKVTLVWTDPEGSIVSTLVLVNDLDLQVTSAETRKVYLGNDIKWEDTHGTLRHEYDELNNVEQVWLTENSRSTDNSEGDEGPIPGLYFITVHGSHVPGKNGYQKYALVVTGDFETGDSLTSEISEEFLEDFEFDEEFGEIIGDGGNYHLVGQCDVFDYSEFAICPQNCIGNGICKSGHCSCYRGYTGSDCSHEPSGLSMDGETLHGKVQTDGWEFYSLDVYPSNYSEHNVVKLYIDRLSDVGDPDIYVSLSVFPSLGHHDFANKECDTCEAPYGKTKHIIDIDAKSMKNITDYLDDLLPPIHPDQMRNDEEMLQDEGDVEQPLTILIGVYGYCCVESEFQIRASHGRPEGDTVFNLLWIIFIILGVILIVAAIITFVWWKRRRAASTGNVDFINIANLRPSASTNPTQQQQQQQQPSLDSHQQAAAPADVRFETSASPLVVQRPSASQVPQGQPTMSYNPNVQSENDNLKLTPQELGPLNSHDNDPQESQEQLKRLEFPESPEKQHSHEHHKDTTPLIKTN